MASSPSRYCCGKVFRCLAADGRPGYRPALSERHGKHGVSMVCTMPPLDFLLFRSFTNFILYIRPSTVVFSPQPFVRSPLFLLCGHAPRALHNASLESFDRRRCCVGHLSMLALAHIPVCGRCHEIDAELSHLLSLPLFLSLDFRCCSALCLFDSLFS